MIDDGSTDNTLKILKKIAGIKLLTNKRNRGKGYSLRKGFKIARGDVLIIQDADLEYDPKDHVKILSILKNDFIDVVYGSRFMAGHTHVRYSIFYIGNIFLSYFTKILFFRNITDMETCYKAFKRKVVKNIKLTENRFGFEPEMTCKLIKAGYNIKEIPIRYKSRSYKQGKKIGVKDGLRAIYLLINLDL